MTYFIDRRLNPKGKSLANRQRFIRRAPRGFAAHLLVLCATYEMQP